jgi:predicted site-specific integrase-resolvase
LGKVLVPGRPCREPVLKKWIRAGLLRARRRGRSWTIPADEVQRFQAEYCLAKEACEILQVGRTTLARWERSGRVKAVYGRAFSLYRRTDLASASSKLPVTRPADDPQASRASPAD